MGYDYIFATNDLNAPVVRLAPPTAERLATSAGFFPTTWSEMLTANIRLKTTLSFSPLAIAELTDEIVPSAAILTVKVDEVVPSGTSYDTVLVTVLACEAGVTGVVAGFCA